MVDRVPFKRLDAGLVTKLRPSKIPFGACQAGSKNFSLYGGRLSSNKGYKRVTKNRVNQHGYKLAGQYWIGRTNSSTSNISFDNSGLSTDDFTWEIDFTAGRVESRQVLLYKGFGEAEGYTAFDATRFDIAADLRIDSTNATVSLYWSISDGVSVEESFSFEDGDGDPIVPGQKYSAALVFEDGVGSKCYLRKIGGATGTVGGGFSTANTYQNTASDLYIAAMPVRRNNTPTSAKNDQGLVQSQFVGSVQEIRFWRSARSASDIANNHASQLSTPYPASLNCYWKMTGALDDTYFSVSEVGAAGQGSAESPILELRPRQATWLSDGHALGDPLTGYDSSLHFNGRDDGFFVRDSYLYRKQELDDDGIHQFYDQFYFSTKMKVKRLKDRAFIFHWTHVPDDDFGSTIARHSSAYTSSGTSTITNELFTCYLEMVNNAGTYQLCWVVGTNTSGGNFTANRVVSAVSGGLNITDEYTVTATYDYTAGQLHLIISADGALESDTSQALVANDLLPNGTPNDPVGSNRKYAMAIGRGIYRVRKMGTFETDPNSVDVEYDFSNTFEGVLAEVSIGTWDGTSNAEYVIHSRTEQSPVGKNYIRSNDIRSLSTWIFDDGVGSSVADLGSVQSGLQFTDDPGHTWSDGMITTTRKDKVLGVFDHRYRSPSGEVKKVVAVAGGSVYEVNLSTGAMTLLDDGLRNDQLNIVSAAKFQDSLILCCGGKGGNYQLYKDRLFNLSIAPPTGVLPFGLQDQLNQESAALKQGVYRYALAYYSAFQDKWSPVGILLTIDIKCPGGANVAFGTIAEMNQTYPETAESANKPTWDMESSVGTSGDKAQIWMSAWWGQSSGTTFDNDWEETAPATALTTRDAPIQKAGFSHMPASGTLSVSPQVEDPEAVTGDEAVNLITLRADRIEPVMTVNSTLKLRGRFCGAKARLRIDDHSTENVVNSSGIIDFSAGGTVSHPTVISGTGVSNHGIRLPRSLDPQTTHLGFFRTVANGSVFRLAALLPNGTEDFLDNVKDSDLGSLTIDVDTAAVPAVRKAVDFAGRMFFMLDDNNPQRMYISDPALPWSVRTDSTIDFLDGSTLAITGAARTENSMTVFKDDTTFVIIPTSDPNFPFDVDTRVRDVGCVSPHGIANVSETFFFPSQRGIFSYDTSALAEVSDVIQPTWDDVDPLNFKNITAVHDRMNDRVLFSAPSGSMLDDDDEVVNDLMLAFHYKVGADENGSRLGWSYLEIPCRLMAEVHDSNDAVIVLFVDPMGYINQLNYGYNYGLGDNGSLGAPALSAGSYSASQLVMAPLSTTPFPEGYVGLPITVIRTSTGDRYYRMIVSDTQATPSVVGLDHDLPFTPSETNCTVLVGSVEFVWKSGNHSPFGQDIESIFNGLHLQMTPVGSAKTITIQYSAFNGKGDETSTGTENTISYTSGNQEYDRLFGFNPQPRGFRQRITFKSLGIDAPWEVLSMVWMLVKKDRGAFGQ